LVRSCSAMRTERGSKGNYWERMLDECSEM
jgi:hypothetical protein